MSKLSAADYRRRAREHVRAAALELSNEGPRIRYAALELRLAIEALSYDRAKAYEKELPESVYDVWQPRKLLSFLLSIDPLADQRRSLSYVREDEEGNPIGPMKSLGTDRPLKLREIKNHYDALGNFLHTPTLAQLKASTGEDFGVLKIRCSQILETLQQVLSSPISNAVFGRFLTISCLRCSGIMTVRFDDRTAPFDYSCMHCQAPYEVNSVGADTARFTAVRQVVPCAHEDCAAQLSLWTDEIKAGNRIECAKCKRTSEIQLCISKARRAAPTNQ